MCCVSGYFTCIYRPGPGNTLACVTQSQARTHTHTHTHAHIDARLLTHPLYCHPLTVTYPPRPPRHTQMPAHTMDSLTQIVKIARHGAYELQNKHMLCLPILLRPSKSQQACALNQSVYQGGRQVHVGGHMLIPPACGCILKLCQTSYHLHATRSIIASNADYRTYFNNIAAHVHLEATYCCPLSETRHCDPHSELT